MWKCMLAGVGLLLSVSASGRAAEPLTVLAHEAPPYAWQEKGQSYGFAYELVRETMQDLGKKSAIEFVSFRRGWQQVQNVQGQALFVVTRTPEREKSVKWVGPLLKSETYIFQRKGAGLPLYKLEDLGKLNGIAVQLGIGDDTFLTAQGLTNLYRSPSKPLTLRALINQRVDAAPFGRHAVPKLLRDAGLPPDSIEQTPLKLFDNDFYIAFSKDVSDETIQRWQKALDKVKRERYEQLYAKYLR
ncbi:MAG: extracellular solute-binding protein, family 3 [Proteobacteria bacterium]|nr:extracellular solute-binding protein, family 3 [Pseudomonadota bacterium]